MKITCKNISKSYVDNGQLAPRNVLCDLSFELNSGDSLSISGPSGTGKSTLLNMLSGLDKPDTGNIYFDDACFTKLSNNEKTKFRLKYMSLIFQSNNLLKDFNVIENIILPLRYKGYSKLDSIKYATKSLEIVKLVDDKYSSITTLSGGEAQRVGIARALAMNARIILADEPTGNLDKETSISVMNNLVDICKENEITLITVSHDENILSLSNNHRMISMGKLILSTS
jgi:ABC-type lipoprotein export system ATPase subunit